jgi:hypothetical protein
VHAAKHLHVRVDVALGLGNDHVPLALVGEPLRGVHRQAGGARLVQDQRVDVAVVEVADGLVLAGVERSEPGAASRASAPSLP